MSVAYGKVSALTDVNISVPLRQIVTVLGANGAGKSTVLRTISGLMRIQKGYIEVEGKRINGLTPPEIVRMGISHAPEGRELFSDLTVYENLLMGAYTRKNRKEQLTDLEWIFNYFPVLRDRRRQTASTLSGGEQQMLAIGRSLMSRPRYLLLDEPSLGLAPKIVRTIFDILMTINQSGVTILLVEQNAHLALRLAQYAYILETGRISLEGQAIELQKNDHVRKAYLGGGRIKN